MKIEQVPIADLKPAPYNPRVIDDDELAALMRSLEEFGAPAPAVANRTTGYLVGGHQRVEAARRLGWPTFPVVWVEKDEHDERLLNLALNRIRGDWDDRRLAELLRDIGPEVDLAPSGIAPDEASKLIASLEVPPPIDFPDVEEGGHDRECADCGYRWSS